MRNISTLLYLVDDMNLPLDTTVLTSIQDDPLKDQFYIRLLNLLEVDPGKRLVARIMDRIEETG
jgi:hypothetical protein